MGMVSNYKLSEKQAVISTGGYIIKRSLKPLRAMIDDKLNIGFHATQTLERIWNQPDRGHPSPLFKKIVQRQCPQRKIAIGKIEMSTGNRAVVMILNCLEWFQ